MTDADKYREFLRCLLVLEEREIVNIVGITHWLAEPEMPHVKQSQGITVSKLRACERRGWVERFDHGSRIDWLVTDEGQEVANSPYDDVALEMQDHLGRLLAEEVFEEIEQVVMWGQRAS